MGKKKYTVGLQYTVWIDVDAKNSEEATDLACNSNYDLKLDVGKNKTNVNPTYVELQEYSDPIVHTEDEVVSYG